MTKAGRSITSGIAGALMLNGIYEVARRVIEFAPRLDILAMRGPRRIVPKEDLDARRLRRLTLVGDLVANSMFYSVAAGPTTGATWTRAALLGTAGGVGALVLPERMGLGKSPHSERRVNQFMTVAWYLVAGVAAAAVATALADASSRNTAN